METVVDWIGTLFYWAAVVPLYCLGAGTKWLVDKVSVRAVRVLLYVVIGGFNMIFVGGTAGGVMGDLLRYRADKLAQEHGLEVVAYIMANPLGFYPIVVLFGMTSGFWWLKRADAEFQRFETERLGRLMEGRGIQNDNLWDTDARKGTATRTRDDARL